MGSRSILENHKAKSNHASHIYEAISLNTNSLFSYSATVFDFTSYGENPQAEQQQGSHFRTRTHFRSAIIINTVRLT